jgi:hypothetical protein
MDETDNLGEWEWEWEEEDPAYNISGKIHPTNSSAITIIPRSIMKKH